jgi:diaminopimelate decarboxylase
MNTSLYYHDDALQIESVKLTDIANRFGTPCYVYSASAIKNNWQQFDKAFSSIPHTICYAVKANSNIAILNLLAQLGSGFDIVSVGELERVIKAGGSPDKVVFSGVGKRSDEIAKAIESNILCIDIESLPEIDRINDIATQLKKTARVALRVNPNVDANTHAHITTGLTENKFGIDMCDVISACQTIAKMPHLELSGLACHIGSQITKLKPFQETIKQLIDLYKQLKAININITKLNIGGGLGISYQQEEIPAIADYARCVIDLISQYPLHIIIEPGRAIVGNAGALLTRVEYIKQTEHKRFAITDAGMNDLLRPALYDAWQPIYAVTRNNVATNKYDIAGPVCESADIIGKNRELAIYTGDLLAIDCAGAYGFSMSSNYNSRTRPAEVLVVGQQTYLIRQREKIADLFAHEIIPTLEHI